MTPDNPQSSLHLFVALLCRADRPQNPRSAAWRLCVAAIAGALLSGIPAHAQDIWNNNTGTTNWSNPGNWSFSAVPTAGDPVLFDFFSPATSPATVDNIVDADFTINSLTYQTVSTTGYHTTQINPGVSLNINGTGGLATYVGTGTSNNAGTINIYWRVVGPGILTVTNPSGVINVSQGGDNNDHFATLDLSGLTNFAANVGQIWVGCISNISTYGLRPMGIMRLADTNYIRTLPLSATNEPGIMVASYPTGDTALRGTQQLFLGRYNVINSDAIVVGGTKSTGQILFRPGLTGGSAILRGSAGGSDKVKTLRLGDDLAGMTDFKQNGTSVSCSGTLDATGNIIDALVQDLYVGRSETNNTGNSTGVLTFDQGTITADNLYVGYHPGPPFGAFAANALGTVNVNGTATLTVNNDLLLTRKLGTSLPVATLNIASNGTVNVFGNIVSSNGTSTINFNNGGTINMQPTGDATAGTLTVGTLSGIGTITNASIVTNTTLLNPGTSSTVGTLSIAGNFNLAAGATLTFNVTNDTTAGSGINDLINVTGNLTLNNNVLTVIPMASTLASGSYRLFNYTGTRTGSLNFTNPTHYTVSIDYSTPGQVNALVSGSPASVRWNSTNSPLWDTVTTNWFNNTSAAIDRFGQLDNVVINDSGSYTNFLSLTTVLLPNSIQVIGTKDYNLGGAGRISGGASISKLGSGTLTITNANDFTGPVTINGGVLRVANASALGTTNAGTTISGGALDLSGTSLFSPGEFFTIAGNGPTNGGAIINTGAGQNNGVRYVSLTADSSIGSWPGRFDIRGPGGSGSFSGGLYLNGFTLTKLGPAQQSIVDSIVTNAGSIVIGGGILGLTRSQVDGPGYINVLTNVLLFENSSTGYLAKPISVGGGTIRVLGNSIGLGVNITNVSGATIDIAAGLTLTCTNPISGAGALTKLTAGNLILNAVNTYSGPTTIAGGRITLGSGASIANTPSIALSAGTILDVSAVPGIALGAGETISGSGSVIGDVTATGANTFIPGDGPATLSFNNSLTMNSATNIMELDRDPTQIGGGFNDLISVAGDLTLNGVTTLKIAPIGPLSTAMPYTVITYGGSLNGGLANLQVVSDNPRYTFTVVDPATTPGSIQVSVAGTAPILLWTGGQPSNPRAWDLTTSNWLNGALSDRFFAGDSVQFDDTAATNNVSLIATEAPGSMAVTNGTLPYTFGGPGALAGGSLTKDLAAALVFTNSGSVSFSAGVALNNGPVTFANGGTNILSGAVVVNAGPVTFSNNGPDNFAGGLTVNANVNVLNSYANFFGPSITLNAGTLALNQPLDVTVGSTLANTTPFVAGNLVKQGANTLTLSGNNSAFDGPIVVSGGTLKAGNANALGNANGDTTVASGATFDIAGFSLYNPGDIINIAGAGLNSTGAVINTGAAQQNAVRGLNLTADATIAAWSTRWDVRGNGGSGSHSGALNLNGFTLTKLGPSTNSLVDLATIGDGSIEILGGTVSLTRTEVDAPGHINVSTNILLFENFSTADPVTKGIVVSGGTIRLTGSSLTLGSPITNNLPGVTIDVASGQTLTAQGTIVGNGSLSKITAGTLILTAPDSTWGGSTTIGAGTLQIGSGAADGSLADVPTTNNGTLIISSLNSFTITNQITGSGALTMLAGHLTLGGSNTYSGAVLVNSTTATDPNGAILTISNSFALGTNTGNTHIVGNTTGNGRLELLGNISVADPMLIDCRQGGTINLPAILNVSGSNTISGLITGSTGGSDMNFQSDSGKLTMSGGFNCTTTAGTRRLKLMGAAFGEWSGVISNSADGLVNTILIKTNSGTWTLSAHNIYSGNTTIGGGTLALGPSGSINNSPTIDVQSGGVFDVTAVSGGYVLGASQNLRGIGSVAGNVTANGSVTPGESGIGTLTFSGSLVLAGTTTMEINRDTAPNTDLIVANSLTYGGSLVVNNVGSNPQAGDMFDLFDWTTRSGSFGSITLPPLDPGLSWDTSNLTIDGTVRVSNASVVNTGRTNLTFFVSGNSLDISWPADHTGWRLQSQTNPISVGLRSNWFDVPGSTTTNHVVVPINPANGCAFYRMVYP